MGSASLSLQLLVVALVLGLPTFRVSAFQATPWSQHVCRTTRFTSTSSRQLRRSTTLPRAGSMSKWLLRLLLSQPRSRISRQHDAMVLLFEASASQQPHADETEAIDETPTAPVVQIESLSPQQIAELIEISFIQACLSLAQGYVDTLKLFIVAVKASYEQGGRNVDQLIVDVNACPQQTANRPLLPEEQALRSTWIQAVHLVLDHIDHSSSVASATTATIKHAIDPKIRDAYTPILDDIVAASKTRGIVWNTNDFVQSHRGVLPDTIWADPVEMAIVSQTIKVLYYTLVVLAEERLANLEEDDDMPFVAKPKIPRGTGFN